MEWFHFTHDVRSFKLNLYTRNSSDAVSAEWRTMPSFFLVLVNVLNNSSFNQHKITKSNWPFNASPKHNRVHEYCMYTFVATSISIVANFAFECKNASFVLKVVKLRQISAYFVVYIVIHVTQHRKKRTATDWIITAQWYRHFPNEFFGIFVYFRRWQLVALSGRGQCFCKRFEYNIQVNCSRVKFAWIAPNRVQRAICKETTQQIIKTKRC